MPNLTFAVAVRKRFFEVSAQNNFSFALKNKQVFAWGDSSLGQLGRRTAVNQCSPLSICGAVKTFCLIAQGNAAAHGMGTDRYGRAWTWGAGGSGRLGDNSGTNKSTPVSVCGAVKTFCQISIGGNHSAAIDKNGRAWCWGLNTSGQLGDNSLTLKCTPVSVLGAIKTFCKIYLGFTSSLAIDKNGRLWGWGGNANGQLGDNTAANCRSTPVCVCGAIKTFCHIAMGTSMSLAIDRYGRAWSWGNNANGQLGRNSTTAFSTPVSVCGAVKTFCKIAGNSANGMAIDKNGRIWSWGVNSSGQLGDGTSSVRSTPVAVAGTLRTFCEISVGATHAMAIDKNSNVYAWGSNTAGELGQGLQPRTPVSIKGADKTFCYIASVVPIGASANIVAAVDKNGQAWGWGSNSSGQVGDNSTQLRNTPKSVCGTVKTFCKIHCGNVHVLSIDKYGRLWAWGSNPNNVLGRNGGSAQSTPVSVCGAVKTFCHIAARANSVAIDKNGLVWAWGSNFAGEIGNNSLTAQATPVSICGALKTFCQIAAGTNNVLAIDKNGRAWAWGQNSSGGLGNNSSTNFSTPVSVCGAVKTFCKIDSGQLSNVAMAIDKNGRLWSWGTAGGSGMLGINLGSGTRSTPVSVCGAVKTFCHVSLGQTHCLAIDKNGRLWAWGSNAFGQLGDGTLTNRCTPVSIIGATKTFCYVKGSQTYSLAVDKNGKVWSWGFNLLGETGHGFSQSTPIRITTI